MHLFVRLFADPPKRNVFMGPLEGQSFGALFGKLSSKLSGENGAKTCKAENVPPFQCTVELEGAKSIQKANNFLMTCTQEFRKSKISAL